MIEINEETHYNTAEAAAHINVSLITFGQLIEHYQIPWTTGDDGVKRYKQADLDKIPRG